MPWSIAIGLDRSLFVEFLFYWRLIDCSFGVIGVLPLLICLRYINDKRRKWLSKRLRSLQLNSGHVHGIRKCLR